jgi:hypothetical protein
MCSVHSVITKTLTATQGRQGTGTELDECEYTVHQALGQAPQDGPADDVVGDGKGVMATLHFDCLNFVLREPSLHGDKPQNLSTFCAGGATGTSDTVSDTGTTGGTTGTKGPTDTVSGTDAVKPLVPLKLLLLSVASLAVSLVLV